MNTNWSHSWQKSAFWMRMVGGAMVAATLLACSIVSIFLYSELGNIGNHAQSRLLWLGGFIVEMMLMLIATLALWRSAQAASIFAEHQQSSALLTYYRLQRTFWIFLNLSVVAAVFLIVKLNWLFFAKDIF